MAQRLLVYADSQKSYLFISIFFPIELLSKKCCIRIHVGEIAKRFCLSRPAVSHHIKILIDAGSIELRREGRYYYYYIDYSVSELNKLEFLFSYIREFVNEAPAETKRSEGDGEDHD